MWHGGVGVGVQIVKHLSSVELELHPSSLAGVLPAWASDPP